MKIDTDVDIDLGSRDTLLKLIDHVPAAMRNVHPIRKHSTGVHVTDIPYDPINKMAAIDYKEAASRGYFKLDLLNVHVYNSVRDEAHLDELMKEPDWSMLKDRAIVEQLIHLGNHFNSLCKTQGPVNSIPRLAMFLAMIRPAKRFLIGESWEKVNKLVWDKDHDGYSFKKSHSLAYAQLVVVHMNLLKEKGECSLNM